MKGPLSMLDCSFEIFETECWVSTSGDIPDLDSLFESIGCEKTLSLLVPLESKNFTIMRINDSISFTDDLIDTLLVLDLKESELSILTTGCEKTLRVWVPGNVSHISLVAIDSWVSR